MTLYVQEHPAIACSTQVNTEVFDALIDHLGRGTDRDRTGGWEKKRRQLTAVCKSICATCPALEACMTVEAPREFFDRGVVAGMTDERRAKNAEQVTA